MYLSEIELRNFRNYENRKVAFSPGINVFIGENAQGKTNLLEAIYVLAMTRSHRTANDRELINWQAKEALVKGTVIKQTGRVPLEVLAGNARQAGQGQSSVSVTAVDLYWQPERGFVCT